MTNAPQNTESKLVATILCGAAESLIEDAIRSVVGWVDEICLIDTGNSGSTLQRARAIEGVVMTRSEFSWSNDFAEARNFALMVAERAGASWALTLDTDERLEFPGFENPQHLKQCLELEPKVASWLVNTKCGSYAKSRFVRLPAKSAKSTWRGRTHETLTIGKGSVSRILEGCQFWEVAKPARQFREKLERDLLILLEETTAMPDDARWWYYLGQTYEGLKLYPSAVAALDKCIRLDGWADESSWACYVAARCLVAQGDYRQAEEYCALGITRKPTVAELPWLAGWCCFKRGAWQDAVCWSQWASQLGLDKSPSRAAVFRHLPAWYEAPFDVLRYAARRLGDERLVEAAEAEYQVQQAARLEAMAVE